MNIDKLPIDIEQRLRHLDVLDKVAQISLANNSMQDVLRGILDLVLDIFKADRAWFLYPCDPEAPFWNVPMERTVPEWPGLFAQGVDMPMDSSISETFRELLGTNSTIQYGPDTDHPVPSIVAQHFSVKSQLMIRLHPKIGKDWVFGLHHCACVVKHDESELRLFTSIAFRIADTLSALITVEQLREQVEKRTRDLEEARDTALQSSQAKSDFIANISHEIRTPLTPIIGFAESILQDNPDAATRNSMLSAIIRNGRHLFNVINEILDLSKIDADKLEIEKIEVDISQLFHDIDSLIGTMAREKGLEFHKAFIGPVPRSVNCDPTRIKQILMNLLTNSIKFTEKGRIDLYLEFDPISKLLQFIVSDTGIGIPQEKLDRLFNAFSQADSSITRRFGGTGLGLHISQRLAKLLGGHITVQSVQNVGTKFNVTLPAEGDHLDDLISTPDTAVPLAYSTTQFSDTIPQLKGHVLLAEDSLDNQRLVSLYLTKTGATVSTAENGQIALEMAMADDFDLILMDMQMPVMGGAEAVEMLRSCGCETPIVALTANAMKGDREKYTKIGCNDFLGKPIKQSAFYHYLAKYLSPSGEGQASTVAAKDDEFIALQAGFLDSLNGYVERLREAIAQDNFQVVSEQAHMLKGMGGSFGFPEITQRAGALEKAMKSAQYSQGAALCERLCDMLELTIAARTERKPT